MMIQNVKQLFEHGNSLLLKGKYNEALGIFEKIIEHGDNEYLSGSYVNMAKCLIESSLVNKEDESEKIETYLQEALRIKPTNQAAFSNYFWFHLSHKRFVEAIKYFLKLEVKQFFEQGLVLLEKIHDYKNEEEAEAFYHVYKKFPIRSLILFHVTKWHIQNNSPHIAYQHLKESLPNSGNDLNVLSGLSLVCNILHNPKEAEEYCLAGLRILEAYKQRDERVENSLDGFQSNLALSYLQQNKYEEAIDLLTEKVKSFPNNTDYHNLAYAHYMLGNIDAAYENCKKALSIFEDETSFFLMGECLFVKKEYGSALQWYKRALAFMDGEENVVINYKNERMNIVSTLLDSKQTLKTIYVNIIYAFIENNDFITAKVFHEIAMNKFPYDNEFRKLSGTLRVLDSKEIEIVNVNQKIQSISDEMKEQKNLFQNRMRKIKEWGLDLIKLQNRCVKNDTMVITAEEDWRVIENQMIAIADAMKLHIESESVFDYKRVAENFSADFGKLHEKSFKFLCTGEYLYQFHLNDSTIDFAPIMIEFCKVVENELNEVLKQRKIINGKRNYTLGQLLFELERQKIINFIELIPVLKTILVYRNGSAHTGSTTSEKTGRVRQLLIEEGWLAFILKQKQK